MMQSGGGVNWTTGWKFIIVWENENQHSKINLIRCSKLWNWQIQTLLATQFNSKESVDLCSFWKVATHSRKRRGFGSLVYSIRSQKSPELGLLWAKRVPTAHPHKSSLAPPPGLICARRQCEALSITLGKFAISGEFHTPIFCCEWFPCKNRKV